AVLVLNETLPHADPSDVLIFKILDRQPDELCHIGDIFFVDPDVARRAGAAIAATSTGESQSLLVPDFTRVFVGAHEILLVCVAHYFSVTLAISSIAVATRSISSSVVE